MPKQRSCPSTCTATACTRAPGTAIRLVGGPSTTPLSVNTAACPSTGACSFSSAKPPLTFAKPQVAPSGVLSGINVSSIIARLILSARRAGAVRSGRHDASAPRPRVPGEGEKVPS